MPSAAVKAYKSTALIRCDLKDDYRGTSIPLSDCTVPIKRRCSHIQRRVFSLDPQRNRWRRDCATLASWQSQNEEGERRGLKPIDICRRYASLGIAFSFAGADIAKLPSWVFYPGVILMAAGIVVRQWSIAVLGRSFSGALRVQKDQTLVDSGPYRYVRHPSVHWGAYLLCRIRPSASVMGGCPCARTNIRGGLWVPNARGGAGLDLGAWRGLHFIFAEDEKAHSLRSLNGSSTPRGAVGDSFEPGFFHYQSVMQALKSDN